MHKLVAGAANVPKQIPDEYIDYILCEKFGWLPSQLDNEDSYTLEIFLQIISLENKEKEKEYKRLKRK